MMTKPECMNIAEAGVGDAPAPESTPNVITWITSRKQKKNTNRRCIHEKMYALWTDD